MDRPTLLECFCGAGGSAAGYAAAGFHVVGVDNRPQKHFPFEFVLGDALAYIKRNGHRFDVISASPPCQAYSRSTAWVGNRRHHPDLIGMTRIVLEETGKPYVIENVQEARHHLRSPLMLCGSMVDLPLQRHRYFETNCLGLVLTPDCRHWATDYSFDHGKKQTESVYRDAMECQWMTVLEARQAIPPRYTKWIGERLMVYLRGECHG